MGLFKSQGYKVEKKQNKWNIKEVATNQFLGSYEYMKQADNHARQFNLGKGFGGWTPSFMVRRLITFYGTYDEEQ